MEHFTASGRPMNNAAEVTKLATCKRCGDDKLGWKKSSRTGKWYLCDVQACGRWATRDNPTYRRYFLLARLPHKCAEKQVSSETLPKGWAEFLHPIDGTLLGWLRPGEFRLAEKGMPSD